MNYTEPPVVPIHRQPSPDQGIELGKHEIRIGQSQEKCEATVSIEFQPTPWLRFNILPSQATLATLVNRELIDVQYAGETFSMIRTRIQFSWPEPGDCDLEPRGDKPLPGGTPSGELVRAVVHIFNFPDFMKQPADVLSNGMNGQVIGVADLCADEWKVRISGNWETRAMTDALKNGARFGITHAAEITKNSTEPFSADELWDFIGVLSDFLSFVAGRRCSAALPVGYGKDGKVVWQYWRVPLIAPGPWNPRRSWFDSMNGQSLAAAFPGFYEKWRDQSWPRVFERTIYWYLQSNEDARVISTDKTVILSQIVMEMLAAMSGIDDNGMAADRIRKLLEKSQIRQSLPDTCKQLAEVTKENDGTNKVAAGALTWLRNKIEHPKKNDPIFLVPGEIRDQAYYQASCLALELVDLLLLHYIGYHGVYRSRFETGYMGTVKQVPWTAPPSPG